MPLSSRTRKCLWAFAYASTAAASVYGTMQLMGTDPERLLAGLSAQPEEFSVAFTKPVASTVQEEARINNDDQQPGFQIGPFDSASPQKGKCDLSLDEIGEAKQRQASRLDEVREKNDNSLQSFDYLWNRYETVGECPDNLQILGLDKKQFMSQLRQAAIVEIQEMYRTLRESMRPPERIADILNEAAYAGISDDGIKNIDAGLAAAHLPNEIQLRTMVQNLKIDTLRENINIMRSFTGGNNQPNRYVASLAAKDVRDALEEDPSMAVSLGITNEEIGQVETRINAERDRQYREFDRAHPQP